MNKKTEAKCNGMMLTAGFHGANPPLIWRFDLERNHSFTLALQGEEGDWELGVTSPKGDFYSVVHFLAREDAEEAFAKIEKILSRKSGAFSTICKALIAVLGLAATVVLGVLLFAHSLNNRPAAPASLKPTFGQPMIQREGVPQPADEILQPPR